MFRRIEKFEKRNQTPLLAHRRSESQFYPRFLPLSFASKQGRIIAVVTPPEIVVRATTPCYSRRSLRASPRHCVKRLESPWRATWKWNGGNRRERRPSPPSPPPPPRHQPKLRSEPSRGSIVRREILDTESETSGLAARGLNDRGRSVLRNRSSSGIAHVTLSFAQGEESGKRHWFRFDYWSFKFFFSARCSSLKEEKSQQETIFDIMVEEL